MFMQRSNSTSRFRESQQFVTANTKKTNFDFFGRSRKAKISVTFYSNAAFKGQ